MFIIALILYICGAFLMFAFMRESGTEIETASDYGKVLAWPFICIGSMWIVIKEMVKK